ncbi:MAG: TGS domain-containing protein [Chloroflexi bacterium]|nr:TGS domain-containing protein [Chloroflexota bacterium]
MPANLPPQYHDAEKRFRLARSVTDKLHALEEMMAIMPKHKGTDKLRAELRARMARLREEGEERRTIGRGHLYEVKREGAGQAILVGLPNAGKSQLLAALTSASPRIADFPFTTQVPLPGMMDIEDIQVQIVDMPPIIAWGNQPWVGSLLRKADLLLIVVDLGGDPVADVETIISQLVALHLRPWGKEPVVAEEWEVPKKILIIGNKSDLPASRLNYARLERQYAGQFSTIAVSGGYEVDLSRLRKKIFQSLDIIRVYTKAPGQEADRTNPIILRRGSTAEDAAESIHKDFRRQLKYVQVWGSTRFGGQQVPRNYVLADGDVIELHT